MHLNLIMNVWMFKLSIKRSTNYRIKEEEISNFVNEDEAKQTIKDWIMDKFLINLYVYIHKYSSPYQTLGNNEMYELEKNIIQGETKRNKTHYIY